MTIATGQVIQSGDLNTLYTTASTKLRNFNRVENLYTYYNYNFENITNPTTTILGIRQSVEFTPNTNIDLNLLSFTVGNTTVVDTFSVTITGSTLLSPITVTTTSALSPTSLQTGTYVYPQSGTYHTFFAGATYKISVSNTGLATANYVNVNLCVKNGYRR